MHQKIKTLFGFHAIGSGFVLIPIACSTLVSDPYTPAKWLSAYGVAFASAIALLLFAFTNPSAQSPRVPKPNSWQAWLFALAFLITYAIPFLRHPLPAYENHFLDVGTFMAVLLSTSTFATINLNRFIRAVLAYNLVGTLFVLVYSYLQFFGIEPFPSLSHNEFPSSFFGFQNMTAEFLGLSFLLQIQTLFLYRSRTIRVLVWATMGLTLVSLYILKCRAAAVALVPALLLLFSQSGRISWKKAMPIALIGVTLLGIFAARSYFSTQPSTLDAIKNTNTELRWVRWKNTLEMIRQNPLGVGAGQYEFAYLPYRTALGADLESSEEILVHSPHNDYLRVTAEFGIPFFLFSITILCIALCGLLRARFENSTYEMSRLIVLSLSAFLLTEALFAFPLENAYPFFLLAVMGGIGVRLWKSNAGALLTELALPGRWTLGIIGLFILAGLIGTGGYFYARSKIIETLYPFDPEKVASACEHFPSNWRVCVLKGKAELRADDPAKADQTFQKILDRSPNHYLALRYRAYALFKLNRPTEACPLLAQYDALFANQSLLHGQIAEICKR